MIRKYYTLRENRYYLTEKTGGWKRGDLFDVAIGVYDVAEVCELVGTSLLVKIKETWNKVNIGLYRDDGLAVFTNKTGTHLEKIKKNCKDY